MSRCSSWGPSRSGSAHGPPSARAPLAGTLPAAKPRLPRLQPHVNKKAQGIIAAHLNSTAFDSVETVSSSISYDTSGPVLVQLDSTAPKTAMTHDISHLCDKGHILVPKPPESLIDEQDHVYEATFLPEGPLSVYSDVDGMWHTKVFPSSTPSSRTDAVLLDNWISSALARHHDRLARDQAKDLANAVDALVPILSVALHEVVRQVTHHCTERGATLEKIWQVYVELFRRVLKQMRHSLVDQKSRTAAAQAELVEAKQELQALKSEHPIQMHRVITDLEASFTQQQNKAELDLELTDEENFRLKGEIEALQKELEIWYPTFEKYKESYIKYNVPELQTEGVGIARRRSSDMLARARRTSVKALNDTAKAGEEIPPEVAIAKDFKRLLSVLAPEKRKLIGQELIHVMDRGSSDKDAKRSPRQGDYGSEGVERQDSEQERDNIHILKAEVADQESRIRGLREQIARLESEQAAHLVTEQTPAKSAFKRLPTQSGSGDMGQAKPAVRF